MTDRLKNFISGGQIMLPPDWQKYAADGPYHNMCIFCPDVHHSHGVYVKAPFDNNVEHLSEVRACGNCYQLLGKANQRKGLFSASDRAVDEHAANLMRKYLIDGYVPNKFVFNKYTHIGEDESSELGKCCFCDDVAGKGEFYEEAINNPVHPDMMCSGGQLDVCLACFDLMQQMLSEVVKETPDLELDKCYNCAGEYPVTLEEYEIRKSKSFLCPTCTHQQLKHYLNEDFKPHKDKPYRFSYQRYSAYECHMCKRKEEKDNCTPLMFEPNRFLCSKCNYNGGAPIFIHRYPSACSYTLRLYDTGGTVILYRITADDVESESVKHTHVGMFERKNYTERFLEFISDEYYQTLKPDIEACDSIYYEGSGPLFHQGS